MFCVTRLSKVWKMVKHVDRRFIGTVTSWKHVKGFGFIEFDGDGEKHDAEAELPDPVKLKKQSAFVNRAILGRTFLLKPGTKVEFALLADADGRTPRATSLSFPGQDAMPVARFGKVTKCPVARGDGSGGELQWLDEGKVAFSAADWEMTYPPRPGQSVVFCFEGKDRRRARHIIADIRRQPKVIQPGEGLEGVVTKLFRNHGFIEHKESGAQIFFHRSACERDVLPVLGAHVVFEARKDDTPHAEGKLIASSVQFCRESSSRSTSK